MNGDNTITLHQEGGDGSNNLILLASLDRVKEVVAALLDLSTKATFKPDEE